MSNIKGILRTFRSTELRETPLGPTTFPSLRIVEGRLAEQREYCVNTDIQSPDGKDHGSEVSGEFT